jgi:uncharacterized phage-like protein YoqJ
MIIAGTGHRPKYCPCKYNENHPWLLNLRKSLYEELKNSSFNTIIVGMAIGFDTWLAQEALKLGMNVHAYIPFKGQGCAWLPSSKIEYERILSLCKEVKYISEEYSNDAFFKRDKAMINDCDHVYSLLNPEITSGGTFYTVQYAKKNNKTITNFWKD